MQTGPLVNRDGVGGCTGRPVHLHLDCPPHNRVESKQGEGLRNAPAHVNNVNPSMLIPVGAGLISAWSCDANVDALRLRLTETHLD